MNTTPEQQGDPSNSAAEPAAVGEWALVPREPTDAQLDAIGVAQHGERLWNPMPFAVKQSWRARYKVVHAAMIAAAPAPEAVRGIRLDEMLAKRPIAPERMASARADLINEMDKGHAGQGDACHCAKCDPPLSFTSMRMILCAICGNKRCPHATDHRYACTNSNEPGQFGSAYDTRPAARKGDADSFQDRVAPWMQECFGAAIASDVRERGDRFLEETLELLQSHGYDPGRVETLRDYVWGRPVGEPAQEVGGVMVTLAAYCLATGVDMHEAAETELARVWTKVEAIRAKQAAKRDLHSPLPTLIVPDGQPDAVDADIAAAEADDGFDASSAGQGDLMEDAVEFIANSGRFTPEGFATAPNAAAQDEVVFTYLGAAFACRADDDQAQVLADTLWPRLTSAQRDRVNEIVPVINNSYAHPGAGLVVDYAMERRALEAYESTPGAMYYKGQHEAMRAALTAAFSGDDRGNAVGDDNEADAGLTIEEMARVNPDIGVILDVRRDLDRLIAEIDEAPAGHGDGTPSTAALRMIRTAIYNIRTADWLNMGFGVESQDRVLKYLDAMIANPGAWEDDEWISVEEDLPTEKGWYIGVSHHGTVEPLRWDGRHWHHTRMTRDLAMPVLWRRLPVRPAKLSGDGKARAAGHASDAGRGGVLSEIAETLSGAAGTRMNGRSDTAEVVGVMFTVADRLRALAKQGDFAQEVSTPQIVQILKDYRCTQQIDEDGEASQLVDALTPSGAPNIETGEAEIEALADYIAGYIAGGLSITNKKGGAA